MPLHEVAAYIKANGHLPGVPTEAEIKATGQNLAEVNAILLRKIEELTLHIIELEKKGQASTSTIEHLLQLIEVLTARLERVERLLVTKG
jgi:ABC-type transporter Mla subunit MlaD